VESKRFLKPLQTRDNTAHSFKAYAFWALTGQLPAASKMAKCPSTIFSSLASILFYLGKKIYDSYLYIKSS